jgi:hypothetical protein
MDKNALAKVRKNETLSFRGFSDRRKIMHLLQMVSHQNRGPPVERLDPGQPILQNLLFRYKGSIMTEPTKWTFERLLEAWELLVKVSKNLDEFRPKRDALILESGWEKLEFYTAFDKQQLAKYRNQS